ncbi:MAG: sulfatase [Planctomycetaceae bacterium]|nr:sulfatase [Planctomycetaceae bacterium]
MPQTITDRRQALTAAACGFGQLALAGLLPQTAPAALPGPAPQPHFAPRAKRVIFLFMQGGPSQVDTFDYKPLLPRKHGQSLAFDDARTIAKTGKRGSSQLVKKPLWKFRQYGESGRWVSDLFPEIGRHADQLCMLHSMHTEGIAHGPATLFLHCGSTNLVRPSMGSWVHYGLGSENDNLPGFVSICPSPGNGGARNYDNAFLPPVYRGTTLGSAGRPATEARIRDLVNPRYQPAQQRQQFALLQSINAAQLASQTSDVKLESVISSFELAWRMQRNAPSVLDLTRETESTLQLYGIDQKETQNFGHQCLMARRMCEAGVRYIQVTYGDSTANPAWDQHSNLPKHADHARAVDRPIAGLLKDLKQRGLLEDTLVWWGAEFGRTPYAQDKGTGRDHNPDGFTAWLAGGGVKPGIAVGATDELGHVAVENKIHMHDLHATILHLLGIDHRRLTYRYSGRDFRLTDVHGRVVREIL